MKNGTKTGAVSRGPVRAASSNKILVTGFGRMGLSHAALYNLYNADAPCDIHVYDPSIKLKFALRLSRRFHRMTPVKRLDRGDLNEYQAIFICSPPKAHAPNLRAISGYNGKVFVEKPGFVSAQDIGGLTGENVYIGYVLRHSPAVERVEAIANGRAFTSLNISLTTNVTFGADPENWRDSHAHGGGLLNEFGSHCINLMLYLSKKHLRLIGVSSTGPNQCVLSLSDTGSSTGEPVFTVSLRAGDSSVRKAVYTISAQIKDGPSVWTDLSAVSVKNDGGTPASKQALAEGPLGSKAYLRGHEFSRQMAYFIENADFSGALDDSIATDELLREAHDLIHPR